MKTNDKKTEALKRKLLNLQYKKDEIEQFYYEVDNRDLKEGETVEKRLKLLSKIAKQSAEISQKIFQLEYKLRWA